MNPTSIGLATEVYEAASKCEIIRHWVVDHAELYDISRAYRALVQSLKSEAGEEYWRQTLGPVRRLVSALCFTPLPFGHAAVASCIDWDKLRRQVQACQQIYPDSYPVLSDLVQKLGALNAEAHSPFTTLLESLCSEDGGMSVIIPPYLQRMNQAVAAYFADSTRLRNASVVSVSQQRGAHMCDVLVVIGPCRWFPDYVLSAPRAKSVHVISFRWVPDLWEPGSVFLYDSASPEDKSHKHSIGPLPQIVKQPVLPNPGLPILQPLDLDSLRPTLSFNKTALNNAGWQPSLNEETVSAKYCELSGGRAVFVSMDKRASQIIIDPSETDDSIVRSVPVDALEPNLYLLLRTSGGGDFIAPLADRILGSLAKERRAQQAEWKNRLLATAQERFGRLSHRELSSRISNFLRDLALSITPPVNLQIPPATIHYWMSSKCIRPMKEEHFDIILTFAGLADRVQELWKAMKEIGRAHIKAGHTIRRMLLQKIFTTSLEPLERDGEMVFDLGEQDGGTLSAFQIIRISDEEREIPVNLIGLLLDLEE